MISRTGFTGAHAGQMGRPAALLVRHFSSNAATVSYHAVWPQRSLVWSPPLRENRRGGTLFMTPPPPEGVGCGLSWKLPFVFHSPAIPPELPHRLLQWYVNHGEKISVSLRWKNSVGPNCVKIIILTGLSESKLGVFLNYRPRGSLAATL